MQLSFIKRCFKSKYYSSFMKALMIVDVTLFGKSIVII